MSWIDMGISLFLIIMVCIQWIKIIEHRRAIDTLINYLQERDDVDEHDIVMTSAKNLIDEELL